MRERERGDLAAAVAGFLLPPTHPLLSSPLLSSPLAYKYPPAAAPRAPPARAVAAAPSRSDLLLWSRRARQQARWWRERERGSPEINISKSRW
ncbi:hypothetical protein GUJ93_ZPchr0012g21598 [Zizania palustris]|uniref:Uncharacterized protein n=1 Tax=Zizania palustris TaxID=103762 RepID=A0A8J5WTA3_ZIZPA|nr:hypothetical protein GUJ93_ZPchr0012g21598 [Zizania palustris]